MLRPQHSRGDSNVFTTGVPPTNMVSLRVAEEGEPEPASPQGSKTRPEEKAIISILALVRTT